MDKSTEIKNLKSHLKNKETFESNLSGETFDCAEGVVAMRGGVPVLVAKSELGDAEVTPINNNHPNRNAEVAEYNKHANNPAHGTVTLDGLTVALTQQAYITQMGAPATTYYEALAIDRNGNEYTVRRTALR